MPGTVQISQGYPQNIVERADDGGWEYDLELYVDAPFAEAKALFPAIGATESVWGLIDSAKVLTRRFSTHGDGSFWTKCLLHCGSEPETWMLTAEDGGLQKPLEFHENYRMRWNYHLAMANGTTTHSGYDAATTPKLSAADGKIKKWVKEPSEYLVDWAILDGFEKEKPGVESFIVPNMAITESRRYILLSKAVAAAEYTWPVGTVYSATNYPVALEDVYWLITASRITFDGAYHVLSLTYQGASYWDEDLYGEALPQP
jgi:hypothetical protein